jgi:N-acetylmuramoyl-L-alanine amidase
MMRSIKAPFIVATAFLYLLISASFVANIKPDSKKVKVVCIDAGHGGKDPGCHGDVAKEKDIALAIALKLGAYITEYYPDIKVVYTRTTDVFVELNERAAIANRNNADLFICIHCNSACVRKKGSNGKYYDACNETACGSATYVMGLHKAEGNLDVAMRENDVVQLEDNYQNRYDLNINSTEAEIIYSTYQNVYLDQSQRFAQLCQEQFTTNAGRDSDGVKQAGFLVLWKTAMPSVLIETGFLSNPQEERFLAGTVGQTHMAACIFRAFRSWKDELEGNKTVYNDDIANMKPYVITAADTAGLRKPVNHLATNTTPKADTSKTKVVVVDSTPKIKADTTKAIVNSKPPDAKAVYRVQILSSDKLLTNDDAALKGADGIWHYEQGGIFKYTSGEYYTLADASKHQSALKLSGFAQAFVVAFDEQGNRISTDQAKALNGGK